jgi:hypothetical protein
MPWYGSLAGKLPAGQPVTAIVGLEAEHACLTR